MSENEQQNAFLTNRHPFLRSPLTYFEVFTYIQPSTDTKRGGVREVEWREYKRIERHPEGKAFFGRDKFYSVAVCTLEDFSMNKLREIAVDIWKGAYTWREVNLRK